MLLNMDGLRSPEMLLEWADKKKPRIHYGEGPPKSPLVTTADEVSVWLIHAYWHQPHQRDTAGAAEHRRIVAEGAIREPVFHGRSRSAKPLGYDTVPQSRWSAGWDRHDWLVAATGRDIGRIETIQVLRIPRALVIEPQAARALIEHFRDHVARVRPAGSWVPSPLRARPWRHHTEGSTRVFETRR